MPYVTIPSISRENIKKSAERRWEAVRLSRPDLEPALELQRRLLSLVADLGGLLERGRLPRLSLPPKYLAAKLARGVPAFAGEPIPVPAPVIRPTLLGLCEALEAGGAGEAAAHIREAVGIAHEIMFTSKADHRPQRLGETRQRRVAHPTETAHRSGTDRGRRGSVEWATA